MNPDDVFWQLTDINKRIARIEKILELLPILLVAQFSVQGGVQWRQLFAEGKRMTLCISSQAGCALQCAFCATGAMGFPIGRAATVRIVAPSTVDPFNATSVAQKLATERTMRARQGRSD